MITLPSNGSGKKRWSIQQNIVQNASNGIFMILYTWLATSAHAPNRLQIINYRVTGAPTDLSKVVAFNIRNHVVVLFHGFSRCPDVLLIVLYQLRRLWSPARLTPLHCGLSWSAWSLSRSWQHFDRQMLLGDWAGFCVRSHVLGTSILIYLTTVCHRWRWWHPVWLSLNAVTASLAWFLEGVSMVSLRGDFIWLYPAIQSIPARYRHGDRSFSP